MAGKQKQTDFNKVPHLAAARYMCVDQNPYFGKALWSLVPVEVEDMMSSHGSFIATDDKWRLYFDPKEIEKYSVQVFANLLVHELQHNLKQHSKRVPSFCVSQGIDTDSFKQIANALTDCEINDDLQQEKKELPPQGCFPVPFGKKWGVNFKDDECFEDYALKWLAKYPPQDNPNSGDGENSEGDGDKQEGGKSGSSNPSPMNCGSGAHGKKEPWEKPDDDTSTPAISEAEGDIIRRNTAMDILEHEKTRGTVPAHLKRWAEETITVKINPRKEMAAMIRNSIIEVKGQVNYSWKRQSRRVSAYKRIILPGLLEPVPDVLVLVDTSGSMSGKALGQALALTGKVLKALGQQNIRVICVDAAMQATQKIFRADQITLAGGGGTDMSIGLLHAETMKPKPHLVILITDGYTPWPSRRPKVDKILICLVETTVAKDDCPEWAKIVKMDD